MNVQTTKSSRIRNKSLSALGSFRAHVGVDRIQVKQQRVVASMLDRSAIVPAWRLSIGTGPPSALHCSGLPSRSIVTSLSHATIAPTTIGTERIKAIVSSMVAQFSGTMRSLRATAPVPLEPVVPVPTHSEYCDNPPCNAKLARTPKSKANEHQRADGDD